MNLEDLLDVDGEYPMHCYVCGTTIGVLKQEVVTNETEPFPGETVSEYQTLAVCNRCSNAASTVIDLERANDDLFDRVCVLTEQNNLLAAHLVEGKTLMEQLLNVIDVFQKEIEELKAERANLNDAFEVTLDANEQWFDYAIECEREILDLKRRIAEGAGPDDVEFTIIASADYED